MNKFPVNSEELPTFEAASSKNNTRHLLLKGIVASAIAAASVLTGLGKSQATGIETVPTEPPVVAVDEPPVAPVDASGGVTGDIICPDDGGLYSIDFAYLCPSFNTPTTVVDVPSTPSFDTELPATGSETNSEIALLAGISLAMGIAALALSKRPDQV